MRYVLALAFWALPVVAEAQSQMPQQQMQQMQHGQMHQMQQTMPPGGQHQHSQATVADKTTTDVPREAGQSAFAAIQEIVVILRADPNTDWSKVNVEALRQHLIDMNNVTLAANVKTKATPQTVTFVVTGHGAVKDSIQRMVLAHAATMNGVNGWALSADKTHDGANLTIKAPEAELIKIKALGFIGMMTEGMRHQEHHLALARGVDPHHKH